MPSVICLISRAIIRAELWNASSYFVWSLVNLHIIILFMSSSIVPFIICLFYNNGSETFGVSWKKQVFWFLLSVSTGYKEEGKNAQGSESFVVSNMFFVFLWVFSMMIACYTFKLFLFCCCCFFRHSFDMFDAQLFRKGEIIWKSRRVGVCVRESGRVGFKRLSKAILEIAIRWRVPVRVEKQKALVSSSCRFSFQFKAQFVFSPPPSGTNIDQHCVLRSLLTNLHSTNNISCNNVANRWFTSTTAAKIFTCERICVLRYCSPVFG